MITTIPTPTPEPPPAELTPARAAQHRIGAAIRTSVLRPTARLVMWTASDLAAAAADAGEPFSISIEEMSEATGYPADIVGLCVSELVGNGWIARTEAGRWLPTVPAPRTGT